MKLFNKTGKKEVPNQAPASATPVQTPETPTAQAPASSVLSNTVQQPTVARTTQSTQPAPSQVQTNVTTTSQPSQSVNAGPNPNNTVMSQDKIMPLMKEEQAKAAPSSTNKAPTPKDNTNTASSDKIEE